jgi:predicted nucleic acid-binding protein
VRLIDTNVLIDLASGDPDWAPWSARMLDEAAVEGALNINDVVFAELSIGFDRLEDCVTFLQDRAIRISPMPRPALFLAGKVFQAYRRRGGTRTGVLPDFFIGAHAAVAGLPLVTRDVGRYRRYFPTVPLICP